MVSQNGIVMIHKQLVSLTLAPNARVMLGVPLVVVMLATVVQLAIMTNLLLMFLIYSMLGMTMEHVLVMQTVVKLS